MKAIYIVLFSLLFYLVWPHSLKIIRSNYIDNTIQNGVSIALLSSTANKYLDKDFLSKIDAFSDNPEYFYVKSWGIPWKYNASAEILSGELQLKSFSSGLWVLALNGGGHKVQVQSKKPFGWETFTYEREGIETLLLRKNNKYLRIVNMTEVWADVSDKSLAERFIIKKLSERIEPNIYGVNLGGWLVPEKWITPKLFTNNGNATCDYNLCMILGQDSCEKVLSNHFSTFLNLEEDLKTIQSKGINLVRIPIGYWATTDEQNAYPHVTNSLQYLDKAFDICDQLDLALIVDLHGAKDSQNGKDHSGWITETQHWTDNWENNIKFTLDSIDFLTNRYNERSSFFGIELLNEPLESIPLLKLSEYYYKAYENIRKINKDVVILMSDSFRGHSIEAETFIPKLSPNITGVMIDIHNYQCFDEEDKNLTTEGHLDKVNNEWEKMVKTLSLNNLVVTGEWSLGLPWKTFLGMKQSEIKEFKSIYFKVQKNAFDIGDGSIFWTWRVSYGNVGWSLEQLYNEGYIE